MTAVTNAGPLIALARIHQLLLLPALYGAAIMPAAVRDEVRSEPQYGGAEIPVETEWLQTRSADADALCR